MELPQQRNDPRAGLLLTPSPEYAEAERERRFWMGLLHAGSAAYGVVSVTLFGYVGLTWDQPNRGWMIVLTFCTIIFASILYVLRHRIAVARWRLGVFTTGNIVSFMFAVVFCALDGGIDSPANYFLILPMLFLAIGYPVRVVLVCGAAGMTGYAVLVGLSLGSLPLSTLLFQLMALAIGFMLAIIGAVNRDRQSRNLQQLQRRLEMMASTDALTGCLNQRAFNTTLTKEIDRAVRHRHMLSLLMVDVDHFKRVNDRHGHLMGDELLRQIGTMLRQTARASDVVGRLGGDELALLAPETDYAAARALADRLRKKVRLCALPVDITLSIGVSAAIPDTEHAATLLRRADKALYTAKRRGRDQVVGYDDADVEFPEQDWEQVV